MRKCPSHRMLLGSKEFTTKRCAVASYFPSSRSATAPIKSPGVPACFSGGMSLGCWSRSRATATSLCREWWATSMRLRIAYRINNTTGSSAHLFRSVWMQSHKNPDLHCEIILENTIIKGKSLRLQQRFLELDSLSAKISKKMCKSVAMVNSSYSSLILTAFCHLPGGLNPGLGDWDKNVINKRCQIISMNFRSSGGCANKGLDDRQDDLVEDKIDENMEEWIHPDDRSDMILEKDPELKSLLRELASDFGKEKQEGNTSDVGPSHHEGITAGEKEDKPCAGATFKLDGKVTMDTFDTSVEEAETLEPISAEKGEHEMKFVFSIDDLASILREENAQDICVINIPKEKQYVDYFVVVTGRSPRHLKAMALHINQQYKTKKSKEDPYVLVEGENTDDWICIDFGNIVLHLMSEETREFYELEKLWTLGPEYDDQLRRMKEYETKMQETMESVDLVRTGNKEQKKNGDGRPVISFAR
ncbi:uncharacterized protein LOC121422643 [Lytechinus variegatus]|uniref:uncharacterized protein LOC121422643 n=1 Tax=Lytechinus variegatus TaxID=7654 RepID=UPI001BB2B3DE|nr:uncharacterized protein LOC121422643 [Lytechinus variegatus]